MKRVPECCLVDVPCPPEGEADVIIVGDSSVALVSPEPSQPGEKPKYSTITAGDLVSKKKLPWMATLTTAMCWGGGLSSLLMKAAELTQEIVARNEVEFNGRKVIIFIAWSGNDVFGEGGYAGCRWIHQARHLKTDQGAGCHRRHPSSQEWPRCLGPCARGQCETRQSTTSSTNIRGK